MTILLDIEQRTPEWYAFRKGKIGASYAPIIMGVSPWKTPLQLYNDIINETKTPVTPAMQRGIDKEEEALEWVNNHFGKSALDMFLPIIAQSLDRHWLIASLDGWDGEEALEIKVPGREPHLQAIAGEIPEYYYPQLQHIMMVTKTSDMLYCSYNEKKSALIRCVADPIYQEELLAKLDLFYARTINLEPPPACDRDVNIDSCLAAVEAAIAYEEISAEIEQLERTKETIKKNLLRYATKDKNIIGNLLITKCVRQGMIQYSKIPGYDSSQYEQYRGEPVEYFKISQERKDAD